MGKVKGDLEMTAQAHEALERLEKTYGSYIGHHLRNGGRISLFGRLGRVHAKFDEETPFGTPPRGDAQRSEQGPAGGGESQPAALPDRCAVCRQLASRVGPLNTAGTCIGCEEYLRARRGSD